MRSNSKIHYLISDTCLVLTDINSLNCVSMGFMKFAGTAANKTRYGYKVLQPFLYSSMGNYRPCKVECNTGHVVVVDSMFRPREKLNGVFSTKNSIYTHERDSTMEDLDDA